MSCRLNSESKITFDNAFELIDSLKSVINFTKKVCEDKEILSKYYNLTSEDKLSLSEERNNYINMLSIALDKVKSLENINICLEEEFIILKQYADNSCR